MRLLVTDLDNTLYDWVTFFASAFEAMLDQLVLETGLDRGTLIGEFKAVHRTHGNSEHPFAALEVPSLIRFYGTSERDVLFERLQGPFQAFEQARLDRLKLYDSVRETLRTLQRRGVIVVGHTESFATNAYGRLRRLEIRDCFARLYAFHAELPPHPDRQRAFDVEDFSRLVERVPREERKPNPQLLLDICERQRVPPSEAAYIGDSLSRDIAMAEAAGVTSVWARYGTHYDARHWETLVSISHWTDEDIARDRAFRTASPHVEPDLVADSFADVLKLFPPR